MKLPLHAAWLALSALAWVAPIASAADWAPNLTTAVMWDSNASGADRSADVVSAFAFDARLDSLNRLALGQDDALLGGVAVTYEAWLHYHDLDRAALGLQLAWEHKFGLGTFAPVFALDLAAGARAAGDPDRNARTGSVGVALRKRFDEVTRVALTQEFAREDARQDVYGHTGAETSLELTRDLEEYWSFTFTARWRQGDVLSYATPPRPDLLRLTKAVTENETFDRSMVAYLIEARSLTGGFAATYAFARATSLTFRYEWRQTERSSLRYVNHLVSAALARQF